GEATITAKLADGRLATAKVRVVKADMPDPPSFKNDIIPILTRVGCNSGACHGALAGKGGLKLSLRGYDPESDHFVLTRQASARRVDRSIPEKSLLLQKAARILPHGGGRRLIEDDNDYTLILDWIKAGANPPSNADARLDRIEVLPTSAVLKPKSEMSVLVRAFYADGRVEDVTRWSRFGCSDEDVAKVTEDGRITIAGNGEASITVGFGTVVSTMTVAAPFPNQVADDVYAKSPRHNFIDDAVLRKLQALRLPPSGQCGDHEFIRRAFLDAAGILPTPEEVEKFVADKSPKKRATLIDALLERSEYIDYWAYKWSDLMLVSTRKLPQPAMWSFYRTVRQAVGDNKPWDQFARAVILANGSTLQQGGGNFFVLHKDTAELTESMAVTFMGMSVTCARCHNHPLEKWTQDQYWSMANLFSRVGLKNGERPGEVIVFEQASGDVLHPRRNVGMPPTPLDGKALALEDPRDRRAYFADWLTSPTNPYFAPAIVNRVWRNFMGRGLVEAEDDLRETNPASNRELLDALSKDFVENKFDVKRLIRLIMNSAAYQRSSSKVPGNEQDTRFYSRYLIRRLSGEVILDCLSQVTASPTVFNLVYTGVEGGTAATTNYPLGTRAMQLPDSRVASRFLDAFGRPDRIATCSCERQQDATVGQALMMNNGQVLNDKLRAKNSRVNEWLTARIRDDEAIKRVFLLALGRPPTADEMKKCMLVFKDVPADKPDIRREAIEDLFWAVLSTREFLFNH
ncbi:MAG: DUF1549 and DUF1553 domain-containing protein, partial [Planctomycetes bacterium]|nr:DUF1549 and DUF1553 domain-containing protein [Planctomycetota bacterium]